MGSATLNELPDRVKRPKHSTNKAFDKSGVYLKSPKVADAMIEAVNCFQNSARGDEPDGYPQSGAAAVLPVYG